MKRYDEHNSRQGRDLQQRPEQFNDFLMAVVVVAFAAIVSMFICYRKLV